MSDEQRMVLGSMARSTSLPHRQVVQARALLLAAEGVATNEVARRCSTTDTSVRAWRRRFVDEGIEGVGRIAPGRGRRSWLPLSVTSSAMTKSFNSGLSHLMRSTVSVTFPASVLTGTP